MKLESATVQLILKMAKQKPLFFIWTHSKIRLKKTYFQVRNHFKTINEEMLNVIHLQNFNKILISSHYHNQLKVNRCKRNIQNFKHFYYTERRTSTLTNRHLIQPIGGKNV